MNKKNENKEKKNGMEGRVCVGGGCYWSCRTLQSTNEGYVAWQNSVIATHK